MPEGRQRPRVLIADDDLGIQTAISRLLSPSCDVVGCVVDTAALFEVTPQLRPDVVLLDFSLRGDLNALEVCHRLKTTMPQVHVVAFTAHDDADVRRAAFEAGASGFVWKLHAANKLVRTIQMVVEGTAGSADDGTP